MWKLFIFDVLGEIDGIKELKQMKYPKVLQILALATAITVAAPSIVIPAQASETMETPEEYAGRTGYVLPAGYHYVLDGQYIILDESGNPVLEADAPALPVEPEAPALPEESEAPVEPGEQTPSGPETSVNPDAPSEPGASEDPGISNKPGNSTDIGTGDKDTEDESGVSGNKPNIGDGEQTGGAGEAEGKPDKGDAGQSGSTEESGDKSDKDDTTEQPDGSGESVDKPGKDDTGQSDGSGESVDKPGKDDTEQSDGSGESIDKPDKDDTEQSDGSEDSGDQSDNNNADCPDENQEDQETEAPEESEISMEGETPEMEEMPEESIEEEVQEETSDMEEPASIELAPGFEGVEEEPFYLTSAQFRAIHDRIQYNVDVPIDGIPSFITQEMIVGALKAQDETGYPASVTIAQIIQESGYGKYGPGGEDGKGLSYLAFEYCNLFGIKGKGTAGSVSMKTSEMEADGSTYSTYAGFRSYHTYTECIEDRSKLLKEVYSDLTEDVTDANTFAMKIGRRWATDLNYGKHLINTMRRYDLYRLDEMTLGEFSELIGEFANPCPGSSITSLFGRRNAPIAGASTYHKGLDLGTGAYNIPTYAAKEGTVIFAGEAGACGNLITIDHGDGLVTKYMHHAEIYVKEGDKVEKGQQIGLSGTTGNSTGNHLHFQVEEDGRAVDPLKYLQASVGEAEKAKEAYVRKQAKAVEEMREARLQQVKEMLEAKKIMKKN